MRWSKVGVEKPIAPPNLDPAVTMGEYLLFCHCFNEKNGRIGGVFSVKISPNETVDALRSLIHEVSAPTLTTEITAAVNLTLWLLTPPLQFNTEDFGLNAKLDGLLTRFRQSPASVAKPMIEVMMVSDYFEAIPVQRCLHLIIDVPPVSRKRGREETDDERVSLETRRKRREGIVTAPINAASSATSPLIERDYKGRIIQNRPEASPQTMPISLLHKVFGDFKRDLREYKATPDDNQFASDLRAGMLKSYVDERSRCAEFRAIWKRHGINLWDSSIGATAFTSDGHIQEGLYCSFISEGKNEWHHINSDPLLQAALYYLAGMQAVLERDSIGFQNPCPCLIVYYVGPVIGFAGAILADKVQVEPLAPVYPLNVNYHEYCESLDLARCLGAVRLGIGSLKSYYANMQRGLNDAEDNAMVLEMTEREPFYPYQSSYKAEDGTSVKFKYMERIHPDKLLFLCQSDQDENLCVKFTKRYSPDAHRCCADKGMAPRLYATETLPGDWTMVVMEYLASPEYTCVASSRRDPAITESVKRAADILHQGGFVHGDIRNLNLMVRKGSNQDEWKVKIIDFDWAGKVGDARYPPNVNRREIRRPKGVKDGELILQEHDREMIEYIFDPVLSIYS